MRRRVDIVSFVGCSWSWMVSSLLPKRSSKRSPSSALSGFLGGGGDDQNWAGMEATKARFFFAEEGREEMPNDDRSVIVAGWVQVAATAMVVGDENGKFEGTGSSRIVPV
jgi:hypothetical protein